MTVHDVTAANPVAFGSAEETDESLVTRARAGDSAAFELLMRRHNQRVFRVVRSVLRDTDDIEDVEDRPVCHCRSIIPKGTRSVTHANQTRQHRRQSHERLRVQA